MVALKYRNQFQRPESYVCSRCKHFVASGTDDAVDCGHEADWTTRESTFPKRSSEEPQLWVVMVHL
ncbi:uncharacterized protein AFUA_3G08360 [Aspergillus fumigatus Af293]|uniref:Uncharacterized protein n=2 Tax=Aspergillus fumigatus TaxID=746128 RepID=Q4WX63_ASPFU|nr:hypothetical protein AFUA_3G08360 [Aspergillus fumigatus Af293]EAL92740.1 hypothetical protein AFUA_3G08360 [Aspergillus fumigatus Af293]EDP52901.1 hypothetical protein AFUB_040730 [Aspergillus fumigatus A1163]